MVGKRSIVLLGRVFSSALNEATGHEHLNFITWNVRKIAAQYDILRDLRQAQAQVVLLQETQNWTYTDTAAELGWSLQRNSVNAAEVSNRTVASVKPMMQHVRCVERSGRWVMVLLQTILVLVSVLAEQAERRDCAGRVSGETEGAQQGGQWTEPEMENHSRAGGGADAQDEFPPIQEPFTGG